MAGYQSASLPFARDCFESPTLDALDRLCLEAEAKRLTKLTIVLLGRIGVGKSSLINSMTGESVAPVATWRPPHGRQKPDSSITYVRRRLRRNVMLELVDTPGIPEDGTTGQLAKVLESVHKQCRVVHLFLYVTRLDDARRDRGDFIAATHITKAFGRDCWERCCLVFTHGCALSPDGLSYSQFVRGRRDLVWESLQQTMPLRKLKKRGEEGATSTSLNDEIIEIIPEEPYLFGSDDESLPNSDADEEPSRNRESKAGSKWMAWTKLLQIPDATSEWSERLNAANIVEPAGVEYNYHYLEAPEVVVIESSHFCPTNDVGQRILPDGVAWKQELFDTLAVMVKRIGEAPKDIHRGEVLEETKLDESDWVAEEPRLSEARRELHVARPRRVSYGFLLLAVQLLATSGVIFLTNYLQKLEDAEREEAQASRTINSEGSWRISKDDYVDEDGSKAEGEGIAGDTVELDAVDEAEEETGLTGAEPHENRPGE